MFVWVFHRISGLVMIALFAFKIYSGFGTSGALGKDVIPYWTKLHSNLAVDLVAIFLFYKELLVISFDPVLAATLRLPTELLRNFLLVLLALTVVVSLKTVGVGLVAAMLVTPGATAYLLTRRLPAMMAVAAAIGAFSGITGMYLSFYANIASGAALVLTASTIFLLVFFLAPRRGALWQILQRRT